ncbi:hypothetical protein [Aestuariicoccus sp. MJ-SS9]|uniref:preATP grasp domain-containing protein n=1 Tax=Aestuariicoccus sp. MJ-SS9 TaxID=3079855 RepID=UPI00290A5A8C|nr:hypothetical protein [Aestuariicoccus sp. MJ-SS9]MDU8911618.1 hypothetical protein [Aestuariicoccus sp. MJ-SS9]
MSEIFCPDPCDEIAAHLLRDEPALLSSAGFGDFVRQGAGPGPALLVGDQSEIPLLRTAPLSRFDHRMALLARPGDMVAVRRRDRGFEDYLKHILGLADIAFIETEAHGPAPAAAQIRLSPPLLEACVDLCKRHRGLTLTPYLTTGHVWRLAQAIGQGAGRPVHVNGPTPRAARRANDKLWFADLARRVIGGEATPPTFAAFGPAAAAGLVARIGRSADQVIVKVPDSAGSAGNIRLPSAAVRHLPLAALRWFLLARLRATGWRDVYPLLVGVWDAHVTHSPSVQMWLPHLDQGPPRIEGIFEQRVQGTAATFVGARRSPLPRALQDRIGAEALRIAAVLQRIGFFGRCSFDAVLCHGGKGGAAIHWIECNGRWGGVSIPMTALGRLVPGERDRAMLIVQEILPRDPRPVTWMVEVLDDLLLRPGQTEGGIGILSPPPHAEGFSANLAAIAESDDAAERMMQTALDRLATGT